MYRTIIKERFESGRFDPHHFKKLDFDIRTDIENKTSFLSRDCSLSERLYCYGNGITSKPLCKSCRKNVIFPFWLKKDLQKYRTYCSNKCSNSCSTVKNKKRVIYKERYGVDNPSKAESVKIKKMSTVKKNFGGFGFASKKINEKIYSTIFNKYNVHIVNDIPGWRDKMIRRFAEKPWFRRSKEADNFIVSFLRKNNINKERCLFGSEEFFLNHKRNKNNGIYFYDLVVFASEKDKINKNKEKISLILEYDGGYWHPTIDQSITYRTQNFGFTKISTRDIYLHDKHKELIAKKVCSNFIRIRTDKSRVLP